MIVVTAATGQLGRLVMEGLLATVPADQLVAAVRNPAKAADLAERGVQVREADYDRPETLANVFGAGDRVLLISGPDLGTRVAQHKAVVDAAAAAGVALLAYTSVLQADISPLAVAPDHRATEEYIRASGVPYSFLRNGWYSENYHAAIINGAEHGVIVGSAGDGLIASATRADYAAAAVAVLIGAGPGEVENHDNTVYELSGDVGWTMRELAVEVGAATPREVVYQNLSPEEYARVLAATGMPEPVAELYAAMDVDISRGALSATPGDLHKLIGHPSTHIRETVAALFPRP
ncbi:NAD(P)-dependent oxidoreductase [Sphaerisporangium krabiense]|uniref:NAD(P)H dehydrogenase (Quinone) n=1 Tax=Sphaerisporangium krabiense TaxID=763782 RepID=A0A7W8Z9D9_9ACTN|nr:NAD(P)H-binding protein [Sphaerisporangium krabiense]MBB5629922.1 NAD(P)H dehydrogenase (quinone) [Sphaerisporangium krabiense]GII64023.1 NAD(P)-dependent oxidoreductase [Sphaerisporangium krabiense]